jgi:hypothetical protein
MNVRDEQLETVTTRRFPGKYIVIGLVVFLVIFFGVALALSISLTPAAERFHNPTLPTES